MCVPEVAEFNVLFCHLQKVPREEVEDFTESHGLHALHLWHVQLCGVELVYGWPLRRRVLLQPEDKYEVMNQENVIEVKIKEDGEVKF